MRLFYLGVAVPVQAARRAVAPMSLEAWISAGLLQLSDEDDAVEATVHLWPGEDYFLAADTPVLDGQKPTADIVLPPGPISLMLANAMMQKPGAAALDLGTGSGVLALLVSNNCNNVVAIDRNPRSIEFTKFNMRMNGRDNVDAIEGNLFDPVRRQRFGLIVSNPPFVIGPDSKFIYRDSGLRGDLFCRKLVREAPSVLAEGGFFQMTCNLPHVVGRPWKESLAEWFEGLKCDVVVWTIGVQSAADYATSWIVDTESTEPGVVQQRYDNWMTFFENERIEAVSSLLVTLRNSGADNPWLHIDEPPCIVVGPCGDEIQRCFSIYDRFRDDNNLASLLTRHPRLAPEIRINQELVMTDNGLRIDHIQLRKSGGVQYPLNVDENTAAMLARCDGQTSLGELIQSTATGHGVDRDRLTEQVLPIVRSLLLRSVLLIEDA